MWNRCGRPEFVAVAAIAVLVLAACGSSSGGNAVSQGKTYTIASTEDLSGPLAETGKAYASGFKTYVDWINDQGGVNGHKLKFSVLDDQTKPDTGVTNTKQLLTENPIAFLGHTGSPVMIPQQPILAQAQVPTLTYTGVDQLLKDPYYFTLGMSLADQFNVQAQYIQSKVTGRKPRVVLLIIDSPALTLARTTLKTALTAAGWTVVTDEKLPIGSTDVSTQAEDISKAAPDYIVGGILDAAVPGLISKFKTLGVSAPLINFSPGSADASFQAGAGQFFAEREYVAPLDPAAKVMQDAAKKYGTTADMTSTVFTKGWVAGIVFGAAIKTCGDSCTGVKMQAALQGMSGLDIGGLGGAVSFSASTHTGQSGCRVYGLVNGKIVGVTGVIKAKAAL